MTVSYNPQVATESIIALLRLLFRWRGSWYKLLWPMILVFFFLYYPLNAIYWHVLSEDRKKIYEEVVGYCERFCDNIPVTFVLGFYASSIFKRWWDKFLVIPWPSRFSILIMSHIRGDDEEIKTLRRTLIRYATLGFVLTMCSISPAVKLRFPTNDHITKAGFMLPHEQAMLEKVQTRYNRFYVPHVWASTLLARARLEGRIKDEFGMMALCKEINSFRNDCLSLFNYDWISVPLAYTQLVTLTVYVYSFTMIIGKQEVEGGPGVWFPWFSFIQFIFYNGWLRAAQNLSNPYGQDDDDFDLNAIIDTYLQMAYLLVDTLPGKHPDLTKDRYWDCLALDVPYTVVALQYHNSQVKFGDADFEDEKESDNKRRRASRQTMNFSEESQKKDSKGEALPAETKKKFFKSRSKKLASNKVSPDETSERLTDGKEVDVVVHEELDKRDINVNKRKGDRKRSRMRRSKERNKGSSDDEIKQRSRSNSKTLNPKNLILFPSRRESLGSLGKKAFGLLKHSKFSPETNSAAAAETIAREKEEVSKLKQDDIDKEFQNSVLQQLEELRRGGSK